MMRTISILRLASAGLLLVSMSSFSGCDKENVSPRGGKDCTKPATTTPTTPAPTDTPPTTSPS